MRIITALCIIILITMGIIMMSSCAKDPEENKSKVIFVLDIDGCSCTQHSVFQLSWNKTIDWNLLMAAMYEADNDGQLLCDCSHNNNQNQDLTMIVRVIEPMIREGEVYGFNVILKEDTWLYHDDIAPKIQTILENHQQEILFGNKFVIR